MELLNCGGFFFIVAFIFSIAALKSLQRDPIPSRQKLHRLSVSKQDLPGRPSGQARQTNKALGEQCCYRFQVPAAESLLDSTEFSNGLNFKPKLSKYG